MNGTIEALFEELAFLERIAKKEGAAIGPQDSLLQELVDAKMFALSGE